MELVIEVMEQRRASEFPKGFYFTMSAHCSSPLPSGVCPGGIYEYERKNSAFETHRK